MKYLSVLVLISGMCSAALARTVTPRDLLEVVDFSSPVLSPDGRQVVFRTEQASVERNTYQAVWYVQQVEGSDPPPPRRIADGGWVLRDVAGVSLPVNPVWSPDGRWVYYRASVDGRIDVWRAAVDGSGAVALTQDAADVREFQLVADGRMLRYSVGATRAQVIDAELAQYDAGIRIDQTVPLGQGLFRSGAIDGVAATQRFVHGSLGRGRLLAEVPDHWKELNLATGVHRELTLPDALGKPMTEAKQVHSEVAPWKQAYAANGWVAVLTRLGEGKGLLQKPDVSLSVRPLLGAWERTCTAPLCTGKQITGIQWRPGHDEVLFTVTDPDEGRAQSIYRWNVHSNLIVPVVRAQGLVNGGRAQDSTCGVSSVALVCVTAQANQPPRLERIDLQAANRQVLFEPNAQLARAMAGSIPVMFLRWTDATGQVFTGQFYPAHEVKGDAAPLFVNYYQCTGFVRGGVGDEWPFASLAERGISSLCINEAPYVLDPVERYDNAIAAVDAAVTLLAARGEVDCAKVGMGGLSFGSEVTLWTAMKTKLLAAGSVSTPSLSSTYYLFTSFAGSPLTEPLKKNWGLGAVQETPDRWHVLAPEFHIDSVTVPLLFQMSEQEYLFSLDYATSMLKRNLADMYVFPDEPHQKFQPRHKLSVYERNLDWFGFWLQGVEDQAPVKRAQYGHWRKMRAQLEKTHPVTPRPCNVPGSG